MTAVGLDHAAWTGRWRRRSTGEKSLLALGLLTLAVLSPGPAGSVLVLVTAAAVALLAAQVPARTYLLALAAPTGFVLVGAATVAVQVASTGQPALLSLGLLAVTDQGLATAVEVAARAAAAMAATVLLAATTPVADLLTGLRRLGVPAAVVDVAGLTYRMVFALLDSAVTLRAAQAARLGYVDGRRARGSLGMLAAALLVRSWTRAQRLEAGLAGRAPLAGTGPVEGLDTLAPVRPVSRRFLAAGGAVLVSVAAGQLLLEGPW